MSRLLVFLCLSLLFNIAQAQLPAPEYQKGKATLIGKIVNYNPSENLDFRIGAPNILMGAATTLYPTIDADGTFKIDIPVYHDTQVRMCIGKADLVFLVSPDKKNRSVYQSECPARKAVYIQRSVRKHQQRMVPAGTNNKNNSYI